MSTNHWCDEYDFSFDAVHVRRIGRAGVSLSNGE